MFLNEVPGLRTFFVGDATFPFTRTFPISALPAREPKNFKEISFSTFPPGLTIVKLRKTGSPVAPDLLLSRLLTGNIYLERMKMPPHTVEKTYELP